MEKQGRNKGYLNTFLIRIVLRKAVEVKLDSFGFTITPKLTQSQNLLSSVKKEYKITYFNFSALLTAGLSEMYVTF